VSTLCINCTIQTTPRGLIDTEAAIDALNTGQPSGPGIDVYEQEGDLFFRDLSSEIIADDVFQRLVSFPNVIVTGHQACLTHDALTTICDGHARKRLGIRKQSAVAQRGDGRIEACANAPETWRTTRVAHSICNGEKLGVNCACSQSPLP